MRQKVARLIHNIYRFFAIRDSYVNVQTENEINPRDLLHIFDDGLVALVNGDQLIHPM